MSEASVQQTLQLQNAVVDAGGLEVQNRRLRIAPTGEFQSPDDIADLTMRPSLMDSLQNRTTGDGGARASELIRIRDIGAIRRGYREPPSMLMRYNGQPAIALALSNIAGVNIVDMGRAVDARLQELVAELPVGIEVLRVHWQADVVAAAVNGFLISFAEAVLIVLVVLTIGMGWRLALIIGMALVATILGSFLLMADLQYRLAAYVTRGADHRPGHDGGQCHCGRRWLRRAPAERDGPGQGCCRGGHPAVHAPVRRHGCGRDGLLPHLCIG